MEKQDLLRLLILKAVYQGKSKKDWVDLGSIIMGVSQVWDLDELREAVLSLQDCGLLKVSEWPSRADVEAADPMVQKEDKDPELWRTRYGRLVANLPSKVIVETFKYKRLPSEEPEGGWDRSYEDLPEVEEIHF